MFVWLLMKVNFGVLVVIRCFIRLWCRVWICLCILVSFVFYIWCSLMLLSMLDIRVVLWLDGLE